MLLVSLLNPAVVCVALWLGSQADQWQKVPVAAFAAALAGWLLLYVVVKLGWSGLADVGRASAGLVVTQFFVGLVWAMLAYRWARRGP